MPGETKIEWADASWNPTTGCSVVSPGCAHCYAETFAERWRGVEGHPYEQGFDLRLWPERLDVPVRWTRPRAIFVNSMSDVFFEGIPDEFVARVFAAMAAAPWHRFLVLTKRPERMRELVSDSGFAAAVWEERARAYGGGSGSLDEPWPLPGVWLGVSVENRRFVSRADLLRATPAEARFVSAEPLLGPLVPEFFSGFDYGPEGDREVPMTYSGSRWPDDYQGPGIDLAGIDWLIVGGESGPGARRMELGWAEALVEAARFSGSAPFVKQLGAVWARASGASDRKGGDPAEWPESLRVRETPTVAAAA